MGSGTLARPDDSDETRARCAVLERELRRLREAAQAFVRARLHALDEGTVTAQLDELRAWGDFVRAAFPGEVSHG